MKRINKGEDVRSLRSKAGVCPTCGAVRVRQGYQCADCADTEEGAR